MIIFKVDNDDHLVFQKVAYTVYYFENYVLINSHSLTGYLNTSLSGYLKNIYCYYLCVNNTEWQ